jgi:signal transduction histidine kinase
MFSWDFNIKNHIIEQTKNSEHQFIPYGILGMLGFSGFYFFNTHFIGQNAYENIYLRVFSGILALFLVLHKFWPQKLKKWMPIFWNFTLFFNIPFFFTFMFLKNSGNEMWWVYYMSSLIVFFLLTDWVSCLALLSLGVGVASIAYVMTTPYPRIPDNLFAFLIVYISMIGHALLCSHRNSVAHKERINTMRTLAGAMAHELRTPLGGISLIAQVLKMHIPALVTGYKQAKETNPDLEDADTEYVEKAPDEITLTTRNAFNVIDILLMNVKGASNDAPKETCHIKSTIENALGVLSLIHI